jgi:hypothetical protein
MAAAAKDQILDRIIVSLPIPAANGTEAPAAIPIAPSRLARVQGRNFV